MLLVVKMSQTNGILRPSHCLSAPKAGEVSLVFFLLPHPKKFYDEIPFDGRTYPFFLCDLTERLSVQKVGGEEVLVIFIDI